MAHAPDDRGGRGLDDVDAALAAALERDDGELVDLATLAARADLSLPLLEALVREGFLPARRPGLFAERDLGPVRSGLALLEQGLPLDELLGLAREADAALADIAQDAVELFLGFVRDPVRGTTEDADTAAVTLVDAFETMLPEAERLVGRRFGQLVLAAARDRIGDADADAEVDVAPDADSDSDVEVGATADADADADAATVAVETRAGT